ncbi:hypothetical protein HDU96_001196 [Phlyctochytrium bullatum]|nr:hypothetical protein HDU96_001196 [Phlyctochytrium bullatum]
MAAEASRSTIELARRELRNANALLITTGAGMGVDSGLPDFRGRTGFYNAYPVLKSLGLEFPEVSNPNMLQQDPHLFWGFYAHRYDLYTNHVPHEGFSLLHQHGSTLKHGAFSFTSNIDGSFLKAGFPDDRIIECHGSIHHVQCSRSCRKSGGIQPAQEVMQTLLPVDVSHLKVQQVPECSGCGAPMRPNVLMFDDGWWDPARHDAQEQNYQNWLANCMKDPELRLAIVEIGAGLAVPRVRWESQQVLSRVARKGRGRQAFLVRINPRDPEVPASGTCFSLQMGGLEALRMLLSG